MNALHAVLGLGLLALPLARTGTAAPPTPELLFVPAAEKRAQVERLTAPWKKVQRIYVEYDAAPEGSPSISVPIHRRMAGAFPGEVYHLGAHMPGNQPWEIDPFCQEYFIHDGAACHRWPFNRSYSEASTEKGEIIGGSFTQELFLLVLPCWPATDYKLVDGELPADSFSATNCELRATTESVLGEECLIFQRGGVDTLWIPRSKPLCVARREIRQSGPGGSRQCIVAEKIEEIAPGLWVPTELRSQIFTCRPGANELELERQARIRVRRWNVGKAVPDTLFVPVPPPGALKADAKGGPSIQVVPGGEELLSQMVEFMRVYDHLPISGSSKRGWGPWFWIGAASGLLAAFALLRGEKAPMAGAGLSQPKSLAHSASFTLIELLVTVSIIAVLASLLMPALASAKARGQRVRCLSNLKQFGLAFQLYAGDHEDAVLPNEDGPDVPLGRTWVQGWLGLSGPDCTNTLHLRQSLVGPYLGDPSIWRCPSAGRVALSGATLPRVRTVSLNCFMGAPWIDPGVLCYRRVGEIVRPSPSDALIFLEERNDTINDAAFAMQRDFAPDQPPHWMLRDKPAVLHERSGNLAFADGHAEAHRWQDERTLNPPRDDALMPGNLDVRWLQQHATWRER